MRQNRHRIPLAALLVALLGLVACSGGGNGPALVEEFALLDVNPDSQSYDALVSPRDQLGMTCAWYFGAAS